MNNKILIEFTDPHKKPVQGAIECKVHLCDHAVEVVVNMLEREPELEAFIMEVAGHIAMKRLLGNPPEKRTDPSCN